MGGCPACGNANPERARFCFVCGTPLSAPAAESRKTITVLFLDLIGSTSVAEAMDPESYRHVMTRFFTEVAAVIERHGGKVEKFIGDAVMATYGIPVLREDDALRAVRTAVELRATMQSLNEELQRQWGLRLSIRTGINTGEVVVGAPVGGHDMTLGDATNVAARLEQAAQPGEILIGDSTYQLVRSGVHATAAGPLQLKGKQLDVLAYRLHDLVVRASGGDDVSRPMVGRECELGLALDAFELAAARDVPQLVVVTGSPGLGKSRLLSAIVERVADRAVVAVGNCLPYGQGITYSPLASVIRQVCAATLPDTPDDIAAVVGAVEHADVVIRRVDELLRSGGTAEAPHQLSWAVARLLEQAARRRPVVVVLEDLHWAEPPLLDLVEHVATRTKDVPLLLLTSARPELREQPFWATRPRQISLEPLDAELSRKLVRQCAADVPVSDAVAHTIAEAGGGNPLFLEQTLSMLVDAAKGPRGAGQLGPTDIPVPPSISALLAARVDSLDRSDRELLEQASVIGSEFSLAALSHLAGAHPPEVVSRILDRLVRRDFLETSRFDAADAPSFRFRHVLIREAAYAALSKAARARLHEQVASWLEQQRAGSGIGDEEVVGFHLEHAYRYMRELRIDGGQQAALADRAAQCLANAGRRALSRQDTRAAVGLLSRAVELTAREDIGMARLLLQLGGARMDTDSAGAQQAFTRAAEIAAHLGDRLVETEALLSLADLAARADSSDGATTRLFVQIEQAIELFEQFDHWPGLAIAWIMLSYNHGVRGRQAAKQMAAEKAAHYARLAADGDIEAWARYDIVSALKSGAAPLQEAIASGEELVEWARSSGNRQLEGLTLSALAHMYAMRAQPERARVAAAHARQIHDELGEQTMLANQQRSEYFVERLAGNLPAATQLLRDSYALLDEMGDKLFRSSVAAALADALHLRGEYDEAARYVAITRELAAADDLDAQVGWRRVEAKLLALRGDVAGGEQLARQALGLLADNDTLYLQAEALTGLADVLALNGRVDEAGSLVDRVLELYEAKQNVAAATALRHQWSAVRDGRPRTD